MALIKTVATRAQVLLRAAYGAKSSYADYDYVINFINLVNTDINIRFQALGLNYDTQVVVVEAVPANTVNLATYQADGGPLANLVTPDSTDGSSPVEWRLTGQSDIDWEPVPMSGKVYDTNTAPGNQGVAPGATTKMISVTTAPSVEFGNLATAVVNSASGFRVGAAITVAGSSNAALNGNWTIASVGVGTISWGIPVAGNGVGGTVTQAPVTNVESDSDIVESFEFRGGIVWISPCNQIVDLRIRGDFIPDFAGDDAANFVKGALNVFVYWTCERISKYGPGGESGPIHEGFEKDAMKAEDDFVCLLAKSQMSEYIRLGGRRTQWAGGSGQFTPPIVG